MKRMLTIITGVMLLAYAGVANATTFQLDDIAVSLQQSDPGLQLKYKALNPYAVFDLRDVGESYTFNLFDIWTDETTVNPDDTVAKRIAVSLHFAEPYFANSPTVGGETVGERKWFGLFQYGQVTWKDPVLASFGNTGEVAISLSNEKFNAGVFGLNEGKKNGATVDATVTLLKVDAPVPEPSTSLLLASGLGVLGLLRRKKSKQRAGESNALCKSA